jgi:PHD/YefM family antitoxin component YafN of YafNO toxin-antitoxin module
VPFHKVNKKFPILFIDKEKELYYIIAMVNVTEEKFLASPKEMVSRVQSANEILNIISEDGGYVIIDSHEWRNIYETIYLNNIKGMSESILNASEEPLEDSTPLDELDW